MRFFALIALCLVALLALTSAEELTASVCACPRNYQPLCGSDGHNYSNQCDLNCAAKAKGRTITVAKKGHC
ncbi:serine protease inhibitor Kazal-type 1-like [Drosophila serrata]|uniref:serine protease inhibitor Kazal-type 1-like n=1 Tax=Drosophila serrata TaxID=7274 RepID=UPI000A1D283E|nr:serine protease inhibitor Kazal-type 1-like [Drosophila serrata]XP_020807986.1 serine protease inhibitor Kazal-type 1-like [Drosophila serrata]